MKIQQIIEEFAHEGTDTTICEANVLVSSRRLDDLLEWEFLLDHKDLDYMIAETDEEYVIVTDMEEFNLGRTSKAGLYSGLSDLFEGV